MQALRAPALLQARLSELVLAELAGPCDLGDGVEVVHDVEDDLEIEMDCDLDDDEAAEEEAGTRQYVRFSAPYERIELQASSIELQPESISFAKPASYDLAASRAVLSSSHRVVMRSAETDTAPFAPLEPEIASDVLEALRELAAFRG